MSHLTNESTKKQMNGDECVWLWVLIADNCWIMQALTLLPTGCSKYINIQKRLCLCKKHIKLRKTIFGGFKHVVYLIYDSVLVFQDRIMSLLVRIVSVWVHSIYGLALTNGPSKFLVFKVWQRDKNYFATSARLSLPRLALVFSGSDVRWLINDHRGAIRSGRYRLSWVVGWTLMAALGALRRKHPYSAGCSLWSSR